MKRLLPFPALLLLVILTEWGTAHLAASLSPVKGEDPGILMTVEAVARDGAKDALFFGDSTAAYSLDVKLFQELTGASAENLATNRFLAGFADLALLKRYLARHPPPKAIFMVRGVHMWGTPRRGDIAHEYFPEILPLMSDAPLPLEEEIHAFLAEMLPSVRYSTIIRRRILGREETLENPLSPVFVAGSGSIALAKHILLAEPPLPENLRLLGLFCDLAERLGIPVFVSVAPSAYANADEIEADIGHFLQARRQSTCTYLRLPHLKDSELSDTSHVNIEGSDILTRFAASVYLNSETAHRK